MRKTKSLQSTAYNKQDVELSLSEALRFNHLRIAFRPKARISPWLLAVVGGRRLSDLISWFFDPFCDGSPKGAKVFLKETLSVLGGLSASGREASSTIAKRHRPRRVQQARQLPSLGFT